MAKAGNKTTTTWISLFDARALVMEAYGATQLAETLLKKWLGGKQVRWSCKLFEPARVSAVAVPAGLWLFEANTAYSEGDPAFWRLDLEINWEESWAREKYAHGGNRAYTIAVVREGVLAQLPEEPREREEAVAFSASWVWLAAEARQMKAAGQIPQDMKISEFANKLAKRMLKAADTDRSIRPIQWKSIRNELGKHGLWPSDRIK